MCSKYIHLLFATITLLLLFSKDLHAGFTETLPRGIFMLDESYIQSRVIHSYNNEGEKVPLIEEIKRYEPGLGLQGIIIPEADVELNILLSQLQYGILDNLTAVLAVPLSLRSTVKPRLVWEEGDYNTELGRTYSEQDFWEWAASMDQPRPGNWTGNRWVLLDIVLGMRYRFTEGIKWIENKDIAWAVTVMGALPTGKKPDPEEIVATGTTSWNLHAQGELMFHLSGDKFFKNSLDNRLIIGLDLYYEFLFPHKYKAPKGTNHPLILNYEPYVGERYTIDPGDFMGFSIQTDLVPLKGPALATWLSKDKKTAEKLPPLLTLSLRYTFTYLDQSDWRSGSEIWDWNNEKLWRPGYKNILYGSYVISLFRVGVPLQLYMTYRNMTWIPGKNCRAPNAWFGGIRIPMKF